KLLYSMQKVLTHEVGAGAPCLKCGDKCPGLDLHFWRKICRNCKCKQEDHDVVASVSTRGIDNIGKLLMQDREQFLHFQKNSKPKSQSQRSRNHLSNKQLHHSKSHRKTASRTTKSSSSSSDDGEREYEWTPQASDPKLVDSYVSALPKDKQPIVGSAGAKYRKKQLMRQLPSHDQEPNECHDLTPQETTEMSLFVKQYREKALGVARVEENPKLKVTMFLRWSYYVITGVYLKQQSCAECRNPLDEGDAVVWAERAGSERYWHPGCFSCAECKELLVDLIYFYHDGKIYCGRHYCELHKPRCAACDELIFAPEYTQAEDCYWHLKHFCCWHCDQPLGGKNYVPHDNQPVCIPCYEKTFAHTCSTCSEIIAPNTEWVTFEEHHWHANSNCFKCTQCSQSLVGKPCIPKGSMVFCCSKCK
uniref:Testin n=1 Tax=Ciona savignyi TaxID=51511 RepID=H2YE73_CIOSA